MEANLNKNSDKTHWRKGDKSDYLMSWDIERDTIATITKVVRIDTKIRGKMENCRVAYFKESFKPMIINATNGKVIEKALGTHIIQDWHNIALRVILFVDENVKGFGGGTERGLRLRPAEKKKLTKENSMAWNRAVSHIKEGYDFSKIEEVFEVTKEVKDLINSEANGLS